MKTKLDTLKDAAARLNWQGALRIASKFADLGEQKAAIVRGHEAHNNASFARQLGRDPAGDIEAGIAALCARYGLNRDGTESTAPKAERTKATARRKAVYLELHPETVNGSNQHTRVRQVGEPSERFTSETATSTGRSERAIQRDSERGEKIDPAVVKAPRTSSEAVQAKRRAMLAAADAKGFGPRWAAALEAARAGELPAAPDFSKPTHVSGRKWLAEAVALQGAADLEGLRGLVYDPEGSTGGMLHRYVRFSVVALEARALSGARRRDRNAACVPAC